MSKDNKTREYFDGEMRYLREAAKEFAEFFPQEAAQLNLNKPGPNDAAVEQLFQGFAFLMGRMREKLDDDLPELTEGLVDMLWPQYLRSIPSLSIVELMPDVPQMKASEVIGKGFEVLSQPIGPQQTRCRYSTTQDVPLRPLTLESLQQTYEPDGRSLLRLRFAFGAMADLSQIDLSAITLYLNADAPLANALHLALTLHLNGLYVRLPGAERQPLQGRFSVKGFTDDDRLWAKGDSVFSDYQLMLEYFTFREKFMFVTLRGLEQISIAPGTPWFEVEAVLSKPWPGDFKPSAEHMRLHAVPVINLFALECDPLILNPAQSDYLLRQQDGHTEVYSVDQVMTTKAAEQQDYVPFTSFQHKGGMLRHQQPERYFHTCLKPGVDGRHETWLILGGDGLSEDQQNKHTSLILSLTGTNGMLPRHGLQETLLDSCGKTARTDLRVRNLCAPTMPCYPPNRDRFHWRIFSHLGSNFLPMMDNPEVLRATLALYDWTGSEANRRRLDAIVDVNHYLLERFEKGFLLRGVDIQVTLDRNGFAGDGDICLFGEMLNRFFALYADIHLFNQLTLILQPDEKRLSWDENHSRRIPG
jgi:type VI secretion system protein ImpG